MQTIGARIKARRQERGLNQTQLADLIGVKQSAISMIETGATQSLSGEVLDGLCQHLVTTPDYILRGVSESRGTGAKIAELMALARGMSPASLDALLLAARTVSAAEPKRKSKHLGGESVFGELEDRRRGNE